MSPVAIENHLQVLSHALRGTEEALEFIGQIGCRWVSKDMAGKEQAGSIGIPGKGISKSADAEILVIHERRKKPRVSKPDVIGDGTTENEAVFEMLDENLGGLIVNEVGLPEIVHGEGSGFGSDGGTEVGNEFLGLVECHGVGGWWFFELVVFKIVWKRRRLVVDLLWFFGEGAWGNYLIIREGGVKRCYFLMLDPGAGSAAMKASSRSMRGREHKIEAERFCEIREEIVERGVGHREF